MTGLALKIIALSTMIIDHYGAIFQSNIIIYRIIGRLAFPIYCFLLVEGYVHTSNIKKYAVRLLAFAFISEIPYDLAFFGQAGTEYQNIFFTLFIGLGAVYITDKYGKHNIINSILITFAAAVLADFLRPDYQYLGIIYILAFYYTRNYPRGKRLAAAAVIMFVSNIEAGWVQQFSLLSLIAIYFYNNKPGFKNKTLQMSFYISYPLHLLVFYLISSR